MTRRTCFKEHLRAIPGYGLLSGLYHLLKGPESRSLALIRWKAPPNLFQPSPTTFQDRYPQCFQEVRQRLGDGPGLRLLSFGCSRGDELVSLRSFFPQARIRGLDINPRNVTACRRRLAGMTDSRLEVALAASAEQEPEAFYDAVFAMAVFRHCDLGGKNPPSRCDHLIRFADFERTLEGLIRCLKPGGLLALWHSHFRLSDSALACELEVVMTQTGKISTPLYGADNRLAERSSCRGLLLLRR